MLSPFEKEKQIVLTGQNNLQWNPCGNAKFLPVYRRLHNTRNESFFLQKYPVENLDFPIPKS